MPEPGPGDVRVELRTSGVNPSDVKSRARSPLAWSRVIPHSDGAGIIEKVGPNTDRQPGERVWVWNGQWQRPMGTAAQFIVVPQEQAVPLPVGLSFEEGACLGIPALTAIEAVRLAGDLAGKTILVTGAGNAVGHYVTQLATQAGASVIGTAANASKQAHGLSAGAVSMIDYKREPLGQRLLERTQGAGVDLIIDMDFSSTSALLSQKVLKPHGRLICYGSNSTAALPVDLRTLLWSSLDLKWFLIYDLQNDARQYGLSYLGQLLEKGQLQHTVAGTFALDDIALAHEMVESGQKMGTVVITL